MLLRVRDDTLEQIDGAHRFDERHLGVLVGTSRRFWPNFLGKLCIRSCNSESRGRCCELLLRWVNPRLLSEDHERMWGW
jgi:hypothetical protein